MAISSAEDGWEPIPAQDEGWEPLPASDGWEAIPPRDIFDEVAERSESAGQPVAGAGAGPYPADGAGSTPAPAIVPRATIIPAAPSTTPPEPSPAEISQQNRAAMLALREQSGVTPASPKQYEEERRQAAELIGQPTEPSQKTIGAAMEAAKPSGGLPAEDFAALRERALHPRPEKPDNSLAAYATDIPKGIVSTGASVLSGLTSAAGAATEIMGSNPDDPKSVASWLNTSADTLKENERMLGEAPAGFNLHSILRGIGAGIEYGGLFLATGGKSPTPLTGMIQTAALFGLPSFGDTFAAAKRQGRTTARAAMEAAEAGAYMTVVGNLVNRVPIIGKWLEGTAAKPGASVLANTLRNAVRSYLHTGMTLEFMNFGNALIHEANAHGLNGAAVGNAWEQTKQSTAPTLATAFGFMLAGAPSLFSRQKAFQDERDRVESALERAGAVKPIALPDGTVIDRLAALKNARTAQEWHNIAESIFGTMAATGDLAPRSYLTTSDQTGLEGASRRGMEPPQAPVAEPITPPDAVVQHDALGQPIRGGETQIPEPEAEDHVEVVDNDGVRWVLTVLGQWVSKNPDGTDRSVAIGQKADDLTAQATEEPVERARMPQVEPGVPPPVSVPPVAESPQGGLVSPAGKPVPNAVDIIGGGSAGAASRQATDALADVVATGRPIQVAEQPAPEPVSAAAATPRPQADSASQADKMRAIDDREKTAGANESASLPTSPPAPTPIKPNQAGVPSGELLAEKAEGAQKNATRIREKVKGTGSPASEVGSAAEGSVRVRHPPTRGVAPGAGAEASAAPGPDERVTLDHFGTKAVLPPVSSEPISNERGLREARAMLRAMDRMQKMYGGREVMELQKVVQVNRLQGPQAIALAEQRLADLEGGRVQPLQPMPESKWNLGKIRAKQTGVEAPASPAKEPWQMTLGEALGKRDEDVDWVQNRDPLSAKGQAHREAVEKAVAEGKPVPQNVLKDYPWAEADRNIKPYVESLAGMTDTQLKAEEKRTTAELNAVPKLQSQIAYFEAAGRFNAVNREVEARKLKAPAAPPEPPKHPDGVAFRQGEPIRWKGSNKIGKLVINEDGTLQFDNGKGSRFAVLLGDIESVNRPKKASVSKADVETAGLYTPNADANKFIGWMLSDRQTENNINKTGTDAYQKRFDAMPVETREAVKDWLRKNGSPYEQRFIMAALLAADRKTATETPAAPAPPAPSAPVANAVKVTPTADGKKISVPSKDNPDIAPKEQKKYLLAELDKAISEAPNTDKPLPTTPERDRAIAAKAEQKKIEAKHLAAWEEIRMPKPYDFSSTQEEKDAYNAAKKSQYDDPLMADLAPLFSEYSIPDTKPAYPGYVVLDGTVQSKEDAIPYTPEERVVLLAKKIAAAAETKYPTVKIEVPGDGTFEIRNRKQDIAEFKEKAAKKFPTTTPRPDTNNLPSASTPTIAKVGKRPTTYETGTWNKLLDPFAATDSARVALLHPFVDGKAHAIVATDGRRLAVAFGVKGATTKIPGKLEYPNWKQVIPGGRGDKLPDITHRDNHVIADTEKLIRQLRQAGQVAPEAGRGVDLFVMPDGSIAVASLSDEVGEYRSAELNGAKYLGTHNVDFTIQALGFLRKAGNDSVTLSLDETNPANSPALFMGAKEFVVQMPMRLGDVSIAEKYGLPTSPTATPKAKGKKASPAKPDEITIGYSDKDGTDRSMIAKADERADAIALIEAKGGRVNMVNGEWYKKPQSEKVLNENGGVVPGISPDSKAFGVDYTDSEGDQRATGVAYPSKSGDGNTLEAATKEFESLTSGPDAVPTASLIAYDENGEMHVIRRHDGKTAAPPAKPPEPPKSDIEAGEELKYNRRNRVARRNWDDFAPLNPALKAREVQKNNVWPVPDYQAMIDSEGAEHFGTALKDARVVAAHIAKQVRDAVAAKPNIRGVPTDEDFKRYVEGVHRVEAGVAAWLRDEDGMKAWLQSQGRRAGTMMGAMRGVPTEITSFVYKGPQKTLLDYVYPDGWKAHRDELIALGGNRLLQRLQPGFNELQRAMKDVKAGWPTKREAWQVQGYSVKQAQLRIEENEHNGEKYYALYAGDEYEGLIRPEKMAEFQASIDAKKGFALYKKNRYVNSFATEEEAIDAAREATKREGGGGPTDIQGTNVALAERIGAARRLEGEDITAEKLRDTFGFKGVNFGNWMQGPSARAEAQAHLNHAYDAMLDLAEILNVPPKALSLDGMLGLAIGAQGSGSHAAHFVPGLNEINLTRTAGAGALSHEWAHGLDHYFATLGGYQASDAPYISEHVQLVGADGYIKRDGKKVVAFEGVRPEIIATFRAIVDAMRRRPMTPERTAQLAADRLGRDTKNIDGFLRAIRGNDFHNQEAEYDRLAERVRNGDFGEGRVMVSAGTALSPVVEQMRALYKQKNGRLPSLQNYKGLQAWLDSIIYQRSHADAVAAHVPQDMPTEYYQDAAARDKAKKGKAYWSTNRELFARAFDAYVSDKLAEHAAKNTYLAGLEIAAPQAAERKAIDAAFDKLVGEVKTRETDKGVAMYARSAPGASGAGLTPNDYQSALRATALRDPRFARLLNADRGRVTATGEQDTPQWARDAERRGEGRAAKGYERQHELEYLSKATEIAQPFLDDPQLSGTRIRGELWTRTQAMALIRTARAIADSAKEIRFYRSPSGQVRAVTMGDKTHFFLDRYDNASQLRGDIREEAFHRIENQVAPQTPIIGLRTYGGKWKDIAREIERNYGVKNGTPEFFHELAAKAYRDGKTNVPLWRRFLDAIVRAHKSLARRFGRVLKVSDAEIRNHVNTVISESMGRAEREAGVARNMAQQPAAVMAARNLAGNKAVSVADDAAYLKAAMSGDLKTAQRMVDEAAKAAGSFTLARSKFSDLLRGGKISAVNFGMSGRINDSKVLDPIIEAIPIEMMNVLGTKERASNALLNNPSVFQDALVSSKAKNLVGEDAISRLRDAAMGVAAGARAELASIPVAALDREMFAAVDALQHNLVAAMRDKSPIRSSSSANPLGVIEQPGRQGTIVTRSVAEPALSAPNIAGIFLKLGTTDFADAFRFHREQYTPEAREKQELSFDPITRDDAGRVIPLSERFNPKEQDIRFARGERQSADEAARLNAARAADADLDKRIIETAKAIGFTLTRDTQEAVRQQDINQARAALEKRLGRTLAEDQADVDKPLPATVQGLIGLAFREGRRQGVEMGAKYLPDAAAAAIDDHFKQLRVIKKNARLDFMRDEAESLDGMATDLAAKPEDAMLREEVFNRLTKTYGAKWLEHLKLDAGRDVGKVVGALRDYMHGELGRQYAENLVKLFSAPDHRFDKLAVVGGDEEQSAPRARMEKLLAEYKQPAARLAILLDKLDRKKLVREFAKIGKVSPEAQRRIDAQVHGAAYGISRYLAAMTPDALADLHDRARQIFADSDSLIYTVKKGILARRADVAAQAAATMEPLANLYMRDGEAIPIGMKKGREFSIRPWGKGALGDYLRHNRARTTNLAVKTLIASGGDPDGVMHQMLYIAPVDGEDAMINMERANREGLNALISEQNRIRYRNDLREFTFNGQTFKATTGNLLMMRWGLTDDGWAAEVDRGVPLKFREFKGRSDVPTLDLKGQANAFRDWLDKTLDAKKPGLAAAAVWLGKTAGEWGGPLDVVYQLYHGTSAYNPTNPHCRLDRDVDFTEKAQQAAEDLADLEKMKGRLTAEPSMSIRRVKNNNPILVSDAFDKFFRESHETARVAHLSIPIIEAKRLLHYISRGPEADGQIINIPELIKTRFQPEFLQSMHDRLDAIAGVNRGDARHDALRDLARGLQTFEQLKQLILNLTAMAHHGLGAAANITGELMRLDPAWAMRYIAQRVLYMPLKLLGTKALREAAAALDKYGGYWYMRHVENKTVSTGNLPYEARAKEARSLLAYYAKKAIAAGMSGFSRIERADILTILTTRKKGMSMAAALRHAEFIGRKVFTPSSPADMTDQLASIQKSGLGFALPYFGPGSQAHNIIQNAIAAWQYAKPGERAKQSGLLVSSMIFALCSMVGVPLAIDRLKQWAKRGYKPSKDPAWEASFERHKALVKLLDLARPGAGRLFDIMGAVGKGGGVENTTIAGYDIKHIKWAATAAFKAQHANFSDKQIQKALEELLPVLNPAGGATSTAQALAGAVGFPAAEKTYKRRR